MIKPKMPDLSGLSFGRYHLLEILGEGGMSTVYKAWDIKLEREVAIKIIRRSSFPPEIYDQVLKRFEREAKATARLSHPNIVKVIDYGRYKGSPFLVMEYLPGGTLRSRLGSPIPWREAIALILPIAQALDYAHEQKIIHRDVKPSNILLTSRGQPLISDFGVAKILDAEEGQTLTGSAYTPGTPAYMSPEQILGQAVSARTDIYSLGVVLYELVTGHQPYEADSSMMVIDRHLHDPLPNPSGYVRGLPAPVVKILFKAMAKQPDDRYADMNQFGMALVTLLEGQASKSARRHKEGQASGRKQAEKVPATHDEATRPHGQSSREAQRSRVSGAIDESSLPEKTPAGRMTNEIIHKVFKSRAGRRWIIAIGSVFFLSLIIVLGKGFFGPLLAGKEPTPSPSFYPSFSALPTREATALHTITLTEQRAGTVTQIYTPSQTSTSTSLPRPWHTNTTTPTERHSTETPTRTVTRTAAATYTPTRTQTPKWTDAPTATSTETPGSTLTETPSETLTPSPTETETPTPR